MFTISDIISQISESEHRLQISNLLKVFTIQSDFIDENLLLRKYPIR